MSISKQEAFQHALCIDLTADRLQYAIISKSSKKIVVSKSFELTDFSREGVESLLVDEALKYEYEHLTISAGSSRNTLVPFDLFSSTGARDIFALNYKEPFDNVDYNRIPELGIVNIYEFPIWMKSTMVVKFPRIRLIHRSTVFLKGIFDQPTFSGKIHLLVESQQIYLAITNKSKLLYFNRFETPAFSDLAYHLNFVIQQKELQPEDYETVVYGVDESWDKLEEFQSLCPTKVKMYREIEEGKDFMLAKQMLCV
jgi:hypothetical protein